MESRRKNKKKNLDWPHLLHFQCNIIYAFPSWQCNQSGNEEKCKEWELTLETFVVTSWNIPNKTEYYVYVMYRSTFKLYFAPVKNSRGKGLYFPLLDAFRSKNSTSSNIGQSTLNSKRKYTLLDLSSTQRVADLRCRTSIHISSNQFWISRNHFFWVLVR